MKNYLYLATILTLTGCGASSTSAHVPTGGESGSEARHHGSTCEETPNQPGCGPTLAAPAPPVFIEDDYPRALAEAKAKNLLLFVDSWATWCHSCVSMKSYVFTDPRVAPETDKFVWLSIDTENTKNAGFLAKFPNAAIPTLRVLDPKTETALLTWEGTLTAPELVATLDETRGAAPKNDASRGRDEDAKVTHLYDEKKFEECATEASQNVGKQAGTQRVDVAVMGTTCALELPKDAQQKYLPTFVKELGAIVRDASLPILADDRSAAYEALVDAGQAAGETAAVHENAVAWARFLEGEAAKAKTPAERAVFDPHRLLAYLAMGEPAKAIPMLDETAKDFPDDFNPPARLARVYYELGKYDVAVAQSDKALALAHGPRHLRIALLKADAQAKKGDTTAEIQTLLDALRFATGLPEGQSSPKLVAAVEDRLGKVGPKAKKPRAGK